MGGKIESLYPYIVPLTFLGIWALTWLFNGDSQQLPRRVRGPMTPATGQGGSSSSSSTAPYRAEPRFDPLPRPSSAPRPRPQLPPGSRPPVRKDPDILIIDSDKRSAKPASRRAPNTLERPSATAGLSGLEPTARSLINELKRPATSPNRLDRMVLPESPFTRPSPLSSTVADRSALARPMTPLSDAPIRAATVDQIRNLLRSPQHLRETIALNAILSPPIAARRGAFMNR
jgi:hypothetical protein